MNTLNALSSVSRQAHRSLRIAGPATALLFSTPYVMADDTMPSNPIIVDAHAAPCISTTTTNHFTTITAAIGGVAAGSTIWVCPGNYGEQLTINKSLTLHGVTNTAQNSGAAIITAPANGLNANFIRVNFLGAIPVAAQVLVQATNVFLNDIAIDGMGAYTGCNPPQRLVGIGFDAGSSGTLRRVALRNQNIPDGNGGDCGGGDGVATYDAGNVTILDSTIRGFDESGVFALGTPVVVKTTVFNGPGKIGGAFCFHMQGLGISQFTFNTVMNCGTGVDYVGSSAGTIAANTIVNVSEGINCEFLCSTMNVSGNNIANANSGISTTSIFTPSTRWVGSTFQYNDISSVQVGIDLQFAGGGNTISYNIINDALTGLGGTSGNTVSNNTFLNVTTLMQ